MSPLHKLPSGDFISLALVTQIKAQGIDTTVGPGVNIQIGRNYIFVSARSYEEARAMADNLGEAVNTERTGDREKLAALLPAVQRAVRWYHLKGEFAPPCDLEMALTDQVLPGLESALTEIGETCENRECAALLEGGEG